MSGAFEWLLWVGIGLSLVLSSVAIAIQVLSARRRRRIAALRRELARSRRIVPPPPMAVEVPDGCAVVERQGLS